MEDSDRRYASNSLLLSWWRMVHAASASIPDQVSCWKRRRPPLSSPLEKKTSSFFSGPSKTSEQSVSVSEVSGEDSGSVCVSDSIGSASSSKSRPVTLFQAVV
jgi:hypothetical protein